MEMACQLKTKVPGTRIAAVTFGPMIAEAPMRKCLAMGADQIIHINEAAANENMAVDPWQKSEHLAQAAKALEPDLILCGKESIDTQNGQMGAFMAHHLNLSFTSAIQALDISHDQAVVQRNGGRGIREEILCPLPAVFSVEINEELPHLPTWHDKKEADRMAVESFIVKDGLENLVSSQGKRFPVPPPKQVPEIDTHQNSFNRITQLLSGTRVQKKGTLLTGSSQTLAQGIVSFLEENGFLKSLIEQGES
jgi:electron transfer flavoprotein beta subunit